MLRPALLSLAALAATAAPALAFDPVSDRDAFVAMVEGRDLRIGLMGIELQVLPDGTITGAAVGTPVSGTWSWQDGFFCREMMWGDREIPYNCQLVEARSGQMRFTVDQGAGDSAVFTIE